MDKGFLQKDWEVNINLESAFKKLTPLKKSYGATLSWVDLIILAGNVTVQQTLPKSFGKEMKFCPGRADASEGDGGPNYKHPKVGHAYEDLSIEALHDAICISGLTLRKFTVLYGGGYVIGDSENCNGLYCIRNSFVKEMNHTMTNRIL